MRRFAIAAALLFVAPAALRSQEKGAHDAGLEAVLAAARPGAGHARLKPLEGSFDVEMKAFAAPGVPPTITSARAEKKLILGGRFLEETFSGEIMGMPIEGRGFLGYDNEKSRYVHSWMDTFSSGIQVAEGTFDPDGRVFTLEADRKEVMTGAVRRMREVTRIVDADTHVFEMFVVAPDGSAFRTFELTHTRRR